MNFFEVLETLGSDVVYMNFNDVYIETGKENFVVEDGVIKFRCYFQEGGTISFDFKEETKFIETNQAHLHYFRCERNDEDDPWIILSVFHTRV